MRGATAAASGALVIGAGETVAAALNVDESGISAAPTADAPNWSAVRRVIGLSISLSVKGEDKALEFDIVVLRDLPLNLQLLGSSVPLQTETETLRALPDAKLVRANARAVAGQS